MRLTTILLALCIINEPRASHTELLPPELGVIIVENKPVHLDLTTFKAGIRLNVNKYIRWIKKLANLLNQARGGIPNKLREELVSFDGSPLEGKDKVEILKECSGEKKDELVGPCVQLDVNNYIHERIRETEILVNSSRMSYQDLTKVMEGLAKKHGAYLFYTPESKNLVDQIQLPTKPSLEGIDLQLEGSVDQMTALHKMQLEIYDPCQKAVGELELNLSSLQVSTANLADELEKASRDIELTVKVMEGRKYYTVIEEWFNQYQLTVKIARRFLITVWEVLDMSLGHHLNSRMISRESAKNYISLAHTQNPGYISPYNILTDKGTIQFYKEAEISSQVFPGTNKRVLTLAIKLYQPNNVLSYYEFKNLAFRLAEGGPPIKIQPSIGQRMQSYSNKPLIYLFKNEQPYQPMGGVTLERFGDIEILLGNTRLQPCHGKMAHCITAMVQKDPVDMVRNCFLQTTSVQPMVERIKPRVYVYSLLNLTSAILQPQTNSPNRSYFIKNTGILKAPCDETLTLDGLATDQVECPGNKDSQDELIIAEEPTSAFSELTEELITNIIGRNFAQTDLMKWIKKNLLRLKQSNQTVEEHALPVDQLLEALDNQTIKQADTSLSQVKTWTDWLLTSTPWVAALCLSLGTTIFSCGILMVRRRGPTFEPRGLSVESLDLPELRSDNIAMQRVLEQFRAKCGSV